MFEQNRAKSKEVTASGPTSYQKIFFGQRYTLSSECINFVFNMRHL